MGNTTTKAEPINTKNLVWDKAEQVVKAGVDARKGSSVVLTVGEVKDGDTAKVGNLVCRLDGIDGAETAKTWQKPSDPGQAYGEKAKQELMRLIDKKEVNVTVTKAKDAYGRAVCQIDVQGKNVSAELVKAGAAFLTEKFWSDPPESLAQIGQREALRTFQQDALNNKRGQYSLPVEQRIDPSIHRKTQKRLQDEFQRNK